MHCKNERNHQIDNIKAVMIFLVVWTHFTESFNFIPAKYIYIITYFFHMPVIVYISGYLSRKFDFVKVFMRLILPFLMFELFYTIFYALVFHSATVWYIPHFTLWYLLSLVFFKIMLHSIFKWLPQKFHIGFFILSVIIGMLVGLVPIAKEFSFQRTFVFFPFFVLGYLVRSKTIKFKHLNKFLSLVLLGVTFLVIMAAIHLGIQYDNLYGSYFYENIMDVIYRLMQYIVASIIIYLLFTYCIKGKIAPLSFVAKHSLYVYLIHGFIKLLFDKYEILPANWLGILYAFLFSIFLCLVLSLFGYCFNAIKSKLFAVNNVSTVDTDSTPANSQIKKKF